MLLVAGGVFPLTRNTEVPMFLIDVITKDRKPATIYRDAHSGKLFIVGEPNMSFEIVLRKACAAKCALAVVAVDGNSTRTSRPLDQATITRDPGYFVVNEVMIIGYSEWDFLTGFVEGEDIPEINPPLFSEELPVRVETDHDTRFRAPPVDDPVTDSHIPLQFGRLRDILNGFCGRIDILGFVDFEGELELNPVALPDYAVEPEVSLVTLDLDQSNAGGGRNREFFKRLPQPSSWQTIYYISQKEAERYFPEARMQGKPMFPRVELRKKLK